MKRRAEWRVARRDVRFPAAESRAAACRAQGTATETRRRKNAQPLRWDVPPRFSPLLLTFPCGGRFQPTPASRARFSTRFRLYRCYRLRRPEGPQCTERAHYNRCPENDERAQAASLEQAAARSERPRSLRQARSRSGWPDLARGPAIRRGEAIGCPASSHRVRNRVTDPCHERAMIGQQTVGRLGLQHVSAEAHTCPRCVTSRSVV